MNERRRSAVSERGQVRVNGPQLSSGRSVGGRWAYSRDRLLASLVDVPVVLAWVAVAALAGVALRALDATPARPRAGTGSRS